MTSQYKNPCTCDKCRFSEDCDPVCKTCQGSKSIEQRDKDGCLARCTFYESSMYEGENYCDEWEPRDGGGIAIIIDSSSVNDEPKVRTHLPPPRTEEERRRQEKALMQIEEHWDELYEGEEEHDV